MVAMTKKDQYIRIKDEYRKAHENEPATARMMIDWATEEGLYAVDQAAALKRGAAELADILRSETITDDDGADVRVNMSFEEGNGWLWDDLRTISHPRMELAAAHGRNRMVGEVKSFAKQINYYNGHHPDRPPIQTSFNFENDLKDAGVPIPSSSGLEQLVAQPAPTAPDSSSPPPPSRPSSRRSARV